MIGRKLFHRTFLKESNIFLEASLFIILEILQQLQKLLNYVLHEKEFILQFNVHSIFDQQLFKRQSLPSNERPPNNV